MAQVRTWKDVGAPQITGTDTQSLYTWIKTILQDGYGSYSGLGWEVTNTDNVIIIDQIATGDEGSANIKIKIDCNESEDLSVLKQVSAGTEIHPDGRTLLNSYMLGKEGFQHFGPIDRHNTYPTAYYLQNTLQLTAGNLNFNFNAERNVFASPDGRTIWILDETDRRIGQLKLIEPWDITLANIESSASVYIGDSSYNLGNDNRQSFWAKPEGDYIVFMSSLGRVGALDLNTPWDIRDGFTNFRAFTGTYFSTNSYSTPRGISMSDDGRYIYVLYDSNNRIEQTELATPYHPGTANRSGKTNIAEPAEVGGDGKGIWLSRDGKFFGIGDDGSNGMRWYEMLEAWDLATLRYIGWGGGLTDYFNGYDIPNKGVAYSTANNDVLRQYTTNVPNVTSAEIPWIVVGTDRAFYLISGHSGTEGSLEQLTDTSYFSVQFFGDYDNYVDVDGGNQAIIAENNSGISFSSVNLKTTDTEQKASNAFFGNTGKIRLYKDYLFRKNGLDASYFDTNRLGLKNGVDALRYPYIDGNNYFLPVELIGSDGILYGKLPGAWKILHEKAFGSILGSGYEFIAGSGPFAGKQLLYLRIDDPTFYGEIIIDTSF